MRALTGLVVAVTTSMRSSVRLHVQKTFSLQSATAWPLYFFQPHLPPRSLNLYDVDGSFRVEHAVLSSLHVDWLWES